jgi:hypothetical protein
VRRALCSLLHGPTFRRRSRLPSRLLRAVYHTPCRRHCPTSSPFHASHTLPRKSAPSKRYCATSATRRSIFTAPHAAFGGPLVPAVCRINVATGRRSTLHSQFPRSQAHGSYPEASTRLNNDSACRCTRRQQSSGSYIRAHTDHVTTFTATAIRVPPGRGVHTCVDCNNTEGCLEATAPGPAQVLRPEHEPSRILQSLLRRYTGAEPGHNELRQRWNHGTWWHHVDIRHSQPEGGTRQPASSLELRQHIQIRRRHTTKFL